MSFNDFMQGNFSEASGFVTDSGSPSTLTFAATPGPISVPGVHGDSANTLLMQAAGYLPQQDSEFILTVQHWATLSEAGAKFQSEITVDGAPLRIVSIKVETSLATLGLKAIR